MDIDAKLTLQTGSLCFGAEDGGKMTQKCLRNMGKDLNLLNQDLDVKILSNHSFEVVVLVERAIAWCQRARAALIVVYGGCCQYIKEDGEVCGSMECLEFAHIKPTDLKGAGRGLKERIYDIIKHPLHYNLFCHDCHVIYDREHKESGGGVYGD